MKDNPYTQQVSWLMSFSERLHWTTEGLRHQINGCKHDLKYISPEERPAILRKIAAMEAELAKRVMMK